MLAMSQEFLWIAWLAALAVNVVLASLYSGLEMGVYMANKVRLALRAEAGQARAKTLRNMVRNSDNLLAMLLLGTNIHNYFATFAVSAMVVLAGREDRAEIYTLAIITPMMFVLGDSVPKLVFQRMGSLIYRLTPVLRAADIFFKITGLSYLVRLVSRALLALLGQKQATSLLGHEGLWAVLAEGQASGALSLSQTNMARRVMNMDKLKVADVCQPMDSVISAPQDISLADFLTIIRKHDFSRLPLIGQAGQVVGVIDVYDVLADEQSRPPAEFMTQPMFVPAEANIRDALVQMQRSSSVFAIVTRAGQHVGIVTVKDFVEEITGEL